MIRIILSLTFAVFALPYAADADDIPMRKPGLWEITTVLDKSPPSVTHYCTDATTEARTRDNGLATVNDVCSQHDFRRDGDTFTVDTICMFGSTEVTKHAVTTFAGDTAYHSVDTGHYKSPVSGARDIIMIQDAKWMGACPLNQHPGDMVDPGGTTIRITPR